MSACSFSVVVTSPSGVVSARDPGDAGFGCCPGGRVAVGRSDVTVVATAATRNNTRISDDDDDDDDDDMREFNMRSKLTETGLV